MADKNIYLIENMKYNLNLMWRNFIGSERETHFVRYKIGIMSRRFMKI